MADSLGLRAGLRRPAPGREAEGQTQSFLDTLPATRRRLWRVKALTGLALVAAQSAVLVLVGLSVSRDPFAQPRGTSEAASILLCGAVGYAWGLCLGSTAATVLGAVSRAVIWQVVSVVPVAFAVALLVLSGVAREALRGDLYRLAAILLSAGVAVRSREAYCRPDWSRLTGPTAAARRQAARLTGSIGQAVRDARWFAAGMVLYGVLAAAVLIFAGMAAWWSLTLLLGVLCGVTVFVGDRQPEGGGHDAGWPARAVVRYAIGATAVAVTPLTGFLPELIRIEANSSFVPDILNNQFVHRVGQFVQIDPVFFLGYGLAAGFACGLAAGFLFRRRLSAAVAGFGIACLFGGIWLPSFFANGHPNVAYASAAPAVLVAATAFLAYSRSVDRLTRSRLRGTVAAAFLCAGLATAGSLWHRAYELPPPPDPVDLDAFVASLPGPDANDGGRLTAAALRRLREFRQRFDDEQVRTRRVVPPSFDDLRDEAREVVFHGWQWEGHHQLATFLRQVFEDRWARDLAAAADRPAGALEDPRNLSLPDSGRSLNTSSIAATLLVARGLQRQDGGDPATFVDNLRTGLALARNLRHGTGALAPDKEIDVERITGRGVEHWLARLDGRPAELRRALTILSTHLEAPEADPADTSATLLLILLNTFTESADARRKADRANSFFTGDRVDACVDSLASKVPWETARRRRLLEALASRDELTWQTAVRLAPRNIEISPSFLTVHVNSDGYANQSRRIGAYFARVAALQVALRLFQAENGRPAEKLDDLVPKYLPAIPLDPYDGKPLRYRLSRGETLDWPDPDVLENRDKGRKVPPGQGILWSVGSDGRDDGGHSQAGSHPNLYEEYDEDIISLVPLPPGKD